MIGGIQNNGLGEKQLDYLIKASHAALTDLDASIEVVGLPLCIYSYKFERPPTNQEVEEEVIKSCM